MIINYVKLGSEQYEPAVGAFVADEENWPYLVAAENPAHSEWSETARRLQQDFPEFGKELIASLNNNFIITSKLYVEHKLYPWNKDHMYISNCFKNSLCTPIRLFLLNRNIFNYHKTDLFHNDWAFWSEGAITFGEQDNTSLASLQKIQTTGVTIGVDKKVSNRKMYGFALRVGHDNVSIGTSDTNLKTDMFSLSSYATFPFNNETFIDTHIGIGGLKIDSRRKHEAGFLNGNRNGKQIFGSIVYGAEFSKEKLHISPYGRVDLGYTVLDEYLDSGKVSALKYNEMKIENSKASFGFIINNSIEKYNYKLKPFGRLEYGKGSVYSNDTIVSYYTAYPNTNYTHKGVQELSDNYRVSIGADLDIGKNWYYTASAERSEEIDDGNLNTVNFAGSYIINKNSIFKWKKVLT